MKVTQKLLAIILSLITLITLLASCKAPEPVKLPEDTEESTKNTESIEPEPEPEPEPPYTWVVEPGKVSGDVQPVYNVMSNDICSLGMSIVSDNSVYRLVDSNGQIKGDLYSDGYNYCAVCKGITDHMYLVNPETYIPEEYMGGHGGLNNAPYIYDAQTGEIYESNIGGYDKLEDTLDCAVVQLGTKRPINEDEKDFYNTDFVFENANGYGLVINGKLKQSNFEMYSRYSCGIVALCRDGKWGYYDTKGDEILPCEYSPSTQQLHNSLYEPVNVPYQVTYGVITLCRNGKWGYADIHGNMLTDFEFDQARPVYLNRGWVKTEGGWGVIELDYNYTEATEEDIKENLINNYGAKDTSSIEYVGNTTYYETECKKYLVDGEYTYYVTADGNVITAIY